MRRSLRRAVQIWAEHLGKRHLPVDGGVVEAQTGGSGSGLDRPEPLRRLSACSQVNDSMGRSEADCEGRALNMACW